MKASVAIQQSVQLVITVFKRCQEGIIMKNFLLKLIFGIKKNETNCTECVFHFMGSDVILLKVCTFFCTQCNEENTNKKNDFSWNSSLPNRYRHPGTNWWFMEYIIVSLLRISARHYDHKFHISSGLCVN